VTVLQTLLARRQSREAEFQGGAVSCRKAGVGAADGIRWLGQVGFYEGGGVVQKALRVISKVSSLCEQLVQLALKTLECLLQVLLVTQRLRRNLSGPLGRRQLRSPLVHLGDGVKGVPKIAFCGQGLGLW
jgi:hypothetical protein